MERRREGTNKKNMDELRKKKQLTKRMKRKNKLK